jgi:Cu+-exporting ATPase
MLAAMFFSHSPLHNPWVQFILATPVCALGIAHFGSSALRSLRAGVANMDVLIALGVAAGYSSSVITLFAGLSSETIFFEASSSIVMFILIGHLLEERAVRKTTTAIESLAQLQPRTATRVLSTGNGSQSGIESVRIEEIVVGDLLQVNSGDTIPTDAVIERGSLSCDEMMLTGESLPVEKGVGDRIIGGSIAQDGSAVVRATAVGDSTVLASIVRLVQEAQQRKPKIQRIGDSVSAVFVPSVIAISILVLGGGLLFFNLSPAQALVRALAIAVVACPCAMGLATPTAIMVALGRAATNGILIRGGDTLERLATVQHVAFDKTGTLTTGTLSVGPLTTYAGVSAPEAKALLASIQRNSSHPIARAIVRAFGDIQSAILFSSVTETKGVGITAVTSAGVSYECGGEALKRTHHIDSKDDIILLRDGVCIASVSLSDEVRPEASQMTQELLNLGLSLSIISGDSESKTRSVAGALGIPEVRAEQLPHQKLEHIRTKQYSQPIAYVGDGINDAPTLSEAAVGISLSSASDVAMHSAQVILSQNTLSNLATAIRLARITVRTIKQNLFWAFLYNIVAIPLAAFGYIAPLTGALMMTASDVIIVANSLRIKLSRLKANR